MPSPTSSTMPSPSSSGVAPRGCGAPPAVPTPKVMGEFDAVWVFFRVGAVPCALPAGAVESVERELAVTPAAGAPRSVAGLALVRSHVVPVVDLHRLFRQPAPRSGGSYLVVRLASGQSAALWVSDTEDIERVEPHAFQSVAIPGRRSRYARRVIVREDGRLWLALDAERLVVKGARNVAQAA